MKGKNTLDSQYANLCDHWTFYLDCLTVFHPYLPKTWVTACFRVCRLFL